MAGFLDKIKGMFGGAKSDATTGSGGVDGLKDQAGAAKDKADDLVDEHSDKIPDNVEGTYNKASDQAEKIIPGDGDDAK